MAHIGMVYRCGCCGKAFFSALDANKHFMEELKVERYALPDYGDFGDAIKINGYYTEAEAIGMVADADYIRKRGLNDHTKGWEALVENLRQNRERKTADA